MPGKRDGRSFAYGPIPPCCIGKVPLPLPDLASKASARCPRAFPTTGMGHIAPASLPCTLRRHGPAGRATVPMSSAWRSVSACSDLPVRRPASAV
jgi:hypothetical protein